MLVYTAKGVRVHEQYIESLASLKRVLKTKKKQ